MPAAPGDADVVEDLFGFLRLFSDGSIVRSPVDPEFSPATFPHDHPNVQWRETVYDKANNLRVRMYKPSAAGAEPVGRKLPVLVHFHGGGFCLGSCTWGNVHSFCLRLATEVGAVVLSAGYRLAPEHRLPAALEDAEFFLKWLSDQSANPAADGWLAEAADYGRVFVTGDSAGGTLAHHLAVRAGSAGPKSGEGDVDPLTIKGYLLLMPFFGGVHRSKSEAVEFPLEETPFVNLALTDQFWRLSLPVGATRDHPIANPFGPDSPGLGSVEFPPVLVVTAGTDILRDRNVDYAERLAALGKPVKVVEFGGQPHGFFTLEPWSETTGELIQLVARFVVDSCVVETNVA